MLRGKATPKVQQFGHDGLSTFGIGAELDASQWRSVLRQLVMLRLVIVDHERFNTLRLTEASREVLRGERRLRLRRQVERSTPKRGEKRPVDRARVEDAAPTNGENAIVFQALRQWRWEIAKEHGVPAYTVFHDSTLRELSGTLPQSLGELRCISGIGAKKIERYGPALLSVIQRAGK